MKKILKNFLPAICLVLIFLAPVSSLNASSKYKTNLEDQSEAFLNGAGINSNTTLIEYINIIINIVLGFLGIIFLVLVLISGFNWMTAAGDENKVKTAVNTLKRAVIGLLIIVSAYAITYFVFKNLPAQKKSSGGIITLIPAIRV